MAVRDVMSDAMQNCTTAAAIKAHVLLKSELSSHVLLKNLTLV